MAKITFDVEENGLKRVNLVTSKKKNVSILPFQFFFKVQPR
jgi:hypothetical protein